MKISNFLCEQVLNIKGNHIQSCSGCYEWSGQNNLLCHLQLWCGRWPSPAYSVLHSWYNQAVLFPMMCCHHLSRNIWYLSAGQGHKVNLTKLVTHVANMLLTMPLHCVGAHVNFGSWSFRVSYAVHGSVIASHSVAYKDSWEASTIFKNVATEGTPAQAVREALLFFCLFMFYHCCSSPCCLLKKMNYKGCSGPCITLTWAYKWKFSHDVVIKVAFPFLGKNHCTASACLSLLSSGHFSYA